MLVKKETLLSPEEIKEIDRLCRDQNRTFSNMVRVLLQEALRREKNER